MDDTQLVRQLAELMGWEIGNGTQEEDYSTTHVYYGGDGGYWRGAGPNLSYGPMRPWNPLHSMDDAMQLVEHLRTRTTGDRYWCEMRTPFQDGDRYLAGFTAWAFTGWNGRPDFHALADSLPRAICLAALETREEGNT